MRFGFKAALPELLRCSCRLPGISGGRCLSASTSLGSAHPPPLGPALPGGALYLSFPSQPTAPAPTVHAPIPSHRYTVPNFLPVSLLLIGPLSPAVRRRDILCRWRLFLRSFLAKGDQNPCAVEALARDRNQTATKKEGEDFKSRICPASVMSGGAGRSRRTPCDPPPYHCNIEPRGPT